MGSSTNSYISLNLTINAWAGISPYACTAEEWENWLRHRQGTVQHTIFGKSVPPLQRRRLSLLSKMVLDAAFSLGEQLSLTSENCNVVFASRHSEIATLNRLLGHLSEANTLSPMDFSNSVHHTPISYFSILTKNTGVFRTISAQADSFQYLFLEASQMLQKEPEKSVIAIYGEDDFQMPYDGRYAPGENTAHVIAFCLTSSTGSDLQVSIQPNNLRTTPDANAQPSFDFLHWLLGDEASFEQASRCGTFRWQR